LYLQATIIQTVTSQWLNNYYKKRLDVHIKSDLLLKITFSTDLQLQLITLDTNKDNWDIGLKVPSLISLVWKIEFNYVFAIIAKRVSWFKSSLLLRIQIKYTMNYDS